MCKRQRKVRFAKWDFVNLCQSRLTFTRKTFRKRNAKLERCRTFRGLGNHKTLIALPLKRRAWEIWFGCFLTKHPFPFIHGSTLLAKPCAIRLWRGAFDLSLPTVQHYWRSHVRSASGLIGLPIWKLRWTEPRKGFGREVAHRQPLRHTNPKMTRTVRTDNLCQWETQKKYDT